MKEPKTYLDKMKCPKCGGERGIYRRKVHAGKRVASWCIGCQKTVVVLAGPVT